MHCFMLAFYNFLFNNIHDTFIKIWLFGNIDSINKLLYECFCVIVHSKVVFVICV